MCQTFPTGLGQIGEFLTGAGKGLDFAGDRDGEANVLNDGGVLRYKQREERQTVAKTPLARVRRGFV